MSARRKITIESGALIMFGAIGLWGGLSSYLKMDARMQSSWLKPGLYVSVLSAGLILAALAYGYLALRKVPPTPQDPGRQPWQARLGGVVTVVFGIMALYAFLIPLTGYLPATLLFLLLQFRVLGVGSWRLNMAITASVTAVFYVVFIYYGGLEFPRGVFLD